MFEVQLAKRCACACNRRLRHQGVPTHWHKGNSTHMCSAGGLLIYSRCLVLYCNHFCKNQSNTHVWTSAGCSALPALHAHPWGSQDWHRLPRTSLSCRPSIVQLAGGSVLSGEAWAWLVLSPRCFSFLLKRDHGWGRERHNKTGRGLFAFRLRPCFVSEHSLDSKLETNGIQSCSLFSMRIQSLVAQDRSAASSDVSIVQSL